MKVVTFRTSNGLGTPFIITSILRSLRAHLVARISGQDLSQKPTNNRAFRMFMSCLCCPFLMVLFCAFPIRRTLPTLAIFFGFLFAILLFSTAFSFMATLTHISPRRGVGQGLSLPSGFLGKRANSKKTHSLAYFSQLAACSTCQMPFKCGWEMGKLARSD